MSSLAASLILAPPALLLAAAAAFVAYCAMKYAPIVGRIFEEKPLMLPLRAEAIEGAEDVSFRAADGLALSGSYLRTSAAQRVGVVVFCHEYLGNRWGVGPYADHLRDLGFDLFTFDFRNHGRSEGDAGYQPLQWVSDREEGDLRAALGYLRSRPDRDPAGVGLFGVSRGGGAALVAAASDPTVWGVITDGAFPTRGTVLAYTRRWAEIYVGRTLFHKCLPDVIYRVVGWAGRVRSERRLGCRFSDVEASARRLAPRPWLMIHGAKDAYIGTDIARALFAEAGEPKELWVVPGAKHNRCREVAPDEYAARVAGFFRRHAPRRLAEPVERKRDRADSPAGPAAAPTLQSLVPSASA